MTATFRVAVPAKSHAFKTTTLKSGEVAVTDGMDVDFLDMLMTKLRSKYSVVVPSDRAWGSFINGSWTGIIGMVNRGEVDMALGTLSISEERSKAVDFSYPYEIKEIVFATKPPAMRAKDMAFILPFSRDIWFGTLLILILLPFVFRIIYFKRYKLGHLFLKVLAILLHQSPTFRLRSESQKILLVACLMGTYLLTLTYSSVLLSFLTIPLRSPSVENRNQLAKALVDGSFKCATIAGTSFQERLLRSTDESTHLIGRFIKENNWLIGSDSRILLKYVYSGNTAVVASDDLIALTFQDNIYVSKDHFFSSYIAVAFGKSFRYKNKVDTAIHEITASGTHQKNKKEYRYKIRLHSNRTEAEVQKDDSLERLSILDLKGSFVLLIFGHILAFIVLGLEILYGRAKNCCFQRASI